MELERATKLVNELVEYLKPGCSRIEVAGGIRRGKSDVHDLEIVAVPIPRTRLVFGQKQIFKTELDALLYDMCAQDPTKRDVLNLTPHNKGEKYKKFKVVGSASVFNPNIYLDLFVVTPPAQWGVIYTIRTGSAEFSHWLVTKRSQGGALPERFQVTDGAVINFLTGEILDTPEEIDFLKLLELGWVEPSQREPQWHKFTKCAVAETPQAQIISAQSLLTTETEQGYLSR